MEWDPKIFAAVATPLAVIAETVRRLGWLKIPITRNSKGNPEPVIHAVRLECLAKHREFRASLDTLETDRTETKTKIESHKERIDKHDTEFKEMRTEFKEMRKEVAQTNFNVGILLERTETILRRMK